MRRAVVVGVGLIAAVSLGCSKIKSVNITNLVVKDIALEDQEMLLEKYAGKKAWTRMAVNDITERDTPGEPKKRIIPLDTKVKIIDLNFVYAGAITVQDPKNRLIVHGLEIERPLSVEKIETRLTEIFWFKSPLLRHVDYIRKWGKRTARAVRNHEVFVGMPREAAMEAWGPPTEIRTNDMGDKTEEQWAYKMGKKTNYIYILGDIVSKWEE